jgi:hypothetical protein
LHENGSEWGISTCVSAAKGGHLECLRYAHENGCKWNESVCASSALGDYLECLRYAHENGCNWDWKTCEAAARRGILHVYIMLMKMGDWNSRTSEAAAIQGNLACLKYAHKNGCE